jgi:hypothetical protein
VVAAAVVAAAEDVDERSRVQRLRIVNATQESFKFAVYSWQLGQALRSVLGLLPTANCQKPIAVLFGCKLRAVNCKPLRSLETLKP